MARTAGLIALALLAAGCRGGPVRRIGAPQQLIVERAYGLPVAALRDVAMMAFAPRVYELKPPAYPPDWVAVYVDPGEFLKPYTQLSATDRQNDLLAGDVTGDVYWNSEYVNAAGPVKFHCEFILHFQESPGRTIVQVFEKVPSVWPGMYFTFGHSGPGWYRDIRPVEPTVRDRIDMLEKLSAKARL